MRLSRTASARSRQRPRSAHAMPGRQRRCRIFSDDVSKPVYALTERERESEGGRERLSLREGESLSLEARYICTGKAVSRDDNALCCSHRCHRYDYCCAFNVKLAGTTMSPRQVLGQRDCIDACFMSCAREHTMRFLWRAGGRSMNPYYLAKPRAETTHVEEKI